MTTFRRLNRERYEQRDFFNMYIVNNRLSLRLITRIDSFLRRQNFLPRKAVHESDVHVLKVLPEYLRVTLHYEVYAPIIQVHSLFHHIDCVDNNLFIVLCHHTLKEISLVVAQDLFLCGQPANTMFFTRSGLMSYTTDRTWDTGLNPSLEIQCPAVISEGALWLSYLHVGDLSSIAPSELVSLESDMFFATVRQSAMLYRACSEYAMRFAEAVNQNGSGTLSELGLDFDTIQELAQKSFDIGELNQAFDPDCQSPSFR